MWETFQPTVIEGVSALQNTVFSDAEESAAQGLNILLIKMGRKCASQVTLTCPGQRMLARW